MNQEYMKERPIFKLLISMAAPMMLSMLINSLYNIVDSIFVAKISDNAMTALSLVFPMQNLIISIAVGFGIAINAMVARFLGAKEKELADKTAMHGLVLSIVHGVILSIISILVVKNFLGIFTSDSGIIKYGYDYSIIVMSASTIVMVSVFLEKLYQSVGKMKTTMIGMIIGCIVNIILDPIMIFGLGPIPKMGIKGAAIATVIGQVVTFVFYLYCYYSKPISVKLNKKLWRLNKEICKELYSIGIPATLNMALPSVLISALNGILAAFSPIYIVVLGIYYKLQTFLYLPANGIIQGMRPLISYNYGANEHKRVKDIYKTSLMLIVGIMFIGMMVCMIFPRNLMMLFTSDEEIIKTGIKALRIISLGFIVSSISVTSAGALEALGKGIPSLVISLLRYVIVIIPLAMLFSKIVGAVGVWSSFFVTELITGIVSYIIYKKITK